MCRVVCDRNLGNSPRARDDISIVALSHSWALHRGPAVRRWDLPDAVQSSCVGRKPATRAARTGAGSCAPFDAIGGKEVRSIDVELFEHEMDKLGAAPLRALASCCSFVTIRFSSVGSGLMPTRSHAGAG